MVNPSVAASSVRSPSGKSKQATDFKDDDCTTNALSRRAYEAGTPLYIFKFVSTFLYMLLTF